MSEFKPSLGEAVAELVYRMCSPLGRRSTPDGIEEAKAEVDAAAKRLIRRHALDGEHL